MTRNATIHGTLAYLPKYTQMAFGFRGRIFTLVITSTDQCLEVTVMRSRNDAPQVSVVFPAGGKEERAVRDFFSRNGLGIPHDSESDAEPPSGWYPEVPAQRFFWISPLPERAAGFSALVGDLFREVCGIVDTTPMSFHIEASNGA